MVKNKIVLRQQSSSGQYEVPAHLRTSWTSCDHAAFAKVLGWLRAGALEVDKSSSFRFGFVETFKLIATDSMSIFSIVACIDNGAGAGVIVRLASQCDAAGIPLILGRGPSELGAVFGKRRICCLAILRPATSGMLDFVVGMGGVASQTAVCLADGADVRERFMEVCAKLIRKKSPSEGKATKVVGAKTTKKTPKPPKVLPKLLPKNFSSSFD